MSPRRSRTVALAVVVVALACERPEGRRVLPLAVIDVASGRVSDEWEAPPLLFEVALDGDRLWGVSGAQELTRVGDDGGILWDLSADAPPREVVRLPGIASGEMAIERVHWNAYGALTVDQFRRRAIVSAPTSSSILLVDLNSESVIASYPVALQIHGTGIDSVRGIGYASSFDGVFSFDLLTGDVLETDICLDALSPAGVGVATSANQVFVVASSHEVCRYLPDLGTSEIIETNCLHSPDCHLAGTSTFGNTFTVVAPGSNRVVFLDTLGSPPAERASALFAGHDIDHSIDAKRRFLNSGFCTRIRIWEYDSGAGTWEPADVPIEGDALGIDATDDGTTVFVAQANPRGPLGIHRWLDDPGCSPPILEGAEGAVRR